MKLDDINNSLGIQLVSEVYDSIGGLVIELLEDRLPEEGETVETNDHFVIQVVDIDQTRIQKVRLTIPKTEQEEVEEPSEEEEKEKE